MLIKRKLQELRQIPLLMIMTIVMLSCIGFLMMYDAAYGSIMPWAFKQMMYFAVFFLLMLVVGLISLRSIYSWSYMLYFFSLLFLILVELMGHNAMGATRWINLGIIKLQPSEPMKLATILALARYFHSASYKDILSVKSLIVPALITLLPVLLIVKQPDLGTAIITLLVAVIIFFVAGVRTWKFIAAFSAILLSIPVLWNYLYDYQKQRILIFLDPERDPLGNGYNIIQSKIAIGSGGMFGKGMLNGSQAQLEFLPENQTDFVLSMFAEEFGFVGVMGLMVLYLILIMYGTSIAVNCKSQYGKLLAYGIVCLFSLQVFVNMGMVMGLLPVVGVPLPFLSYGGTMMATILLSFGVLISVKLNCKTKLSEGYLGIV